MLSVRGAVGARIPCTRAPAPTGHRAQGIPGAARGPLGHGPRTPWPQVSRCCTLTPGHRDTLTPGHADPERFAVHRSQSPGHPGTWPGPGCPGCRDDWCQGVGRIGVRDSLGPGGKFSSLKISIWHPRIFLKNLDPDHGILDSSLPQPLASQFVTPYTAPHGRHLSQSVDHGPAGLFGPSISSSKLERATNRPGPGSRDADEADRPSAAQRSKGSHQCPPGHGGHYPCATRHHDG